MYAVDWTLVRASVVLLYFILWAPFFPLDWNDLQGWPKRLLFENNKKRKKCQKGTKLAFMFLIICLYCFIHSSDLFALLILRGIQISIKQYCSQTTNLSNKKSFNCDIMVVLKFIYKDYKTNVQRDDFTSPIFSFYWKLETFAAVILSLQNFDWKMREITFYENEEVISKMTFMKKLQLYDTKCTAF